MTYTGIGIGSGATVSYLVEITKGTMDPSPVWTQVGIVTGGSMNLTQEHVPSYGLGDADRLGASSGNKSYELSFDFNIETVGWDFVELFDGADLTYTIRIEQGISSSSPASTHYMYFLGSRLSDVSVSGSQGGLWEASCTIRSVGLDGDAIVDAAEAGETPYTAAANAAVITSAGNLASGANWSTGATGIMAEVTDCDLSVGFNFADNHVLNSVDPEGIYSGRTECSWSFTVIWKDDGTDINDHITRIIDDESGILIFNVLATGSTLIATLSGCDYDEVSVSLTEGEKSTMDISGTADSCIFTSP